MWMFRLAFRRKRRLLMLRRDFTTFVAPTVMVATALTLLSLASAKFRLKPLIWSTRSILCVGTGAFLDSLRMITLSVVGMVIPHLRLDVLAVGLSVFLNANASLN